MTETKMDALKKLREPFPEHQINLLPKPYKKDSPKGNCKVCGGYHGLPAAHLSYIGHAATTDRLLDVDPFWTWDPMSKDDKGLPLFDKDGGLWITLTVCGITRPGYGDAQGKSGGDKIKEIIGDAIRNGAMRFGVALEQWHKGNLHVDEAGEPGQAPNDPEPERDVDYWEKEADKHADSVDDLKDWFDDNRDAIGALSEADRKKVYSYVSQLRDVLKENEKTDAPPLIPCPRGLQVTKADCDEADCKEACKNYTKSNSKLEVQI